MCLVNRYQIDKQKQRRNGTKAPSVEGFFTHIIVQLVKVYPKPYFPWSVTEFPCQIDDTLPSTCHCMTRLMNCHSSLIVCTPRHTGIICWITKDSQVHTCLHLHDVGKASSERISQGLWNYPNIFRNPSATRSDKAHEAVVPRCMVAHAKSQSS